MMAGFWVKRAQGCDGTIYSLRVRIGHIAQSVFVCLGFPWIVGDLTCLMKVVAIKCGIIAVKLELPNGYWIYNRRYY